MPNDNTVNLLVDALDHLELPNGETLRSAADAGLGHATVANTLCYARSEKDGEPMLYLSLWLRDPAHAANYHQLFFCSVPRIAGVADAPLRVLADICTVEWLNGRSVSYIGRLEPRDLTVPNGPKHVVISGLKVGPAPKGAPNDVPIETFVQRYLSNRKKAKPLIGTFIKELKPKYVD